MAAGGLEQIGVYAEPALLRFAAALAAFLTGMCILAIGVYADSFDVGKKSTKELKSLRWRARLFVILALLAVASSGLCLAVAGALQASELSAAPGGCLAQAGGDLELSR